LVIAQKEFGREKPSRKAMRGYAEERQENPKEEEAGGRERGVGNASAAQDVKPHGERGEKETIRREGRGMSQPHGTSNCMEHEQSQPPGQRE